MSIFRKRLWRDRIATFRTYYKSPKFALIDLSFGVIALFANPYRICRKFLQKRGEKNIYAYGETPFTTYEKIAEMCQIGPKDVWMEMGAGRGKGCFWLAHFIGCKTVGIEWIPSFVYVARAIKMLFGMKKITFELKEMEKADLKGATVIYLYGNCPSLDVPSGVKVISISEPLENFTFIKTFWVRYPWGRTKAFLQIKP